MAIGQCHERNNAVIDASGGAVGLSVYPGALGHWMLAWPEIVRIIREMGDQEKEKLRLRCAHIMEPRHHNQQPAIQAASLKEV